LKGLELRASVFVLSIFAILAAFGGCNQEAGPTVPVKKRGELLTVDFQKDQILRYKFVSTRKIVRDWGATGELAKKGGAKTDTFHESMEMLISYRPIEVNPYGLTRLEATIESIKVKSSPAANKPARNTKDAVKNLAGKHFVFAIQPTGKMEQKSQLEELIRQAAEKTFHIRSNGMRVKDPDMINDFISSQWFLWDPIASIEKPVRGVAVGQSWRSKFFIPSSFVMRKASDVTYTLEQVRQSEKGRLAVIKSTFNPSDSLGKDWPVPYTGSFQVSGRFGILRNFRILQLKGNGTTLFNIDRGRIEQSSLKYRMEIAASLLFPLPGTNPHLTVEQSLQIQLLGN